MLRFIAEVAAGFGGAEEVLGYLGRYTQSAMLSPWLGAAGMPFCQGLLVEGEGNAGF
jgi:hypothetical protein